MEMSLQLVGATLVVAYEGTNHNVKVILKSTIYSIPHPTQPKPFNSLVGGNSNSRLFFFSALVLTNGACKVSQVAVLR